MNFVTSTLFALSALAFLAVPCSPMLNCFNSQIGHQYVILPRRNYEVRIVGGEIDDPTGQNWTGYAIRTTNKGKFKWEFGRVPNYGNMQVTVFLCLDNECRTFRQFPNYSEMKSEMSQVFNDVFQIVYDQYPIYETMANSNASSSDASPAESVAAEEPLAATDEDDDFEEVAAPSTNQIPPPYPTEKINALPTFKAKSANLSDYCAICKEPFGKGDNITGLECAHLFHTACVNKWLNITGACPICKRPLP